MSIISYAQNFEDVILWRALKGVKNGFYIDVGANHPIKDSVTKAFYDRGWTGINIEPELELYELLKIERENDINLNIAISGSIRSVEFYVSSVRGWSTTDKSVGGVLKDKGSFSDVRTIPALTLDSVCHENRVREVHFLKIDVEGAEKDVLESFSFNEVRPWIIVVEATKPTTQIDVSLEWEHILLDNSYIFSYFDGLNKYYVAAERAELADIIKVPPNVFDGYVLASESEALTQAAQAEAKVSEAETRASEAETRASEAEAKVSEAEAKVSEAEAKVSEAETRASEAEAKVSEAEAKVSEAETRASEAEAKVSEAEIRIGGKLSQGIAIIKHKIIFFICNVFNFLASVLKGNGVERYRLIRLKTIPKHAVLYVMNRPNLLAFLKSKLLKYPSLYVRLRKFGLQVKYSVNEQKNKSQKEKCNNLISISNSSESRIFGYKGLEEAKVSNGTPLARYRKVNK